MQSLEKRPIDRGWAWVVLTASTVQFFLFIGFMKSFGIFFVAYLKKYDATSSEVSLVISIQTISTSITSIVVLGVGTRFFTEREFVMYGAFLSAAAQIGNAFAPNVEVLMATQGFLFGMGVAMAHLSMTLILTNYFEKRRGLANSVANIGGSAGGLVWPILLKICLDYYGLAGTLFIVSGLMFQVIVCGALLRPLPPQKDDVNVVTLVKDGADSNKSTDEETKHTDSYEKFNRTRTLPNFKTNEYQLRHPVGGRRRTQSENFTECTKVPSLSQRTARSVHNLQEEFGKLNLSSSLQPLGWLPPTERRETHSQSQAKEREGNSHEVFNFSLLKNPLFYIYTVSSVLFAPTAALTISYIPPFARDCDVSDENVALLVTIIAASDVLGRIGLTFIADSKTLKRHLILAITMLISGLACLFVQFYTDFHTLIVLCVVYGIFGQMFFSLYPVIIVDFLGLENLRHGLTTTTITMGASVALATVIIGKLRDHTGSYLSSFYYMGASALLATVILLMEPLGRRMMNKRKNTDNSDSPENQEMMGFTEQKD